MIPGESARLGARARQSCLKQEIKKPNSSICSVFFSPCLLFPLCIWVGLGERMCLEQCHSSCGKEQWGLEPFSKELGNSRN